MSATTTNTTTPAALNANNNNNNTASANIINNDNNNNNNNNNTKLKQQSDDQQIDEKKSNEKHAVDKEDSSEKVVALLGLLPTEEILTDRVKDRYGSLEPKDVEADKVLSKIGDIMKAAEIDSIEFNVEKENLWGKKSQHKMVFCVCQCGRNKICEARKNQSLYCKKCSDQQSKNTIYSQRRKDNAQMRVLPNSDVPINCLTPEEISIRVRQLNRDRACNELERKRLLQKLTECDIELKNMSEKFREASRKSLKFACDNTGLLRNKVARTLFELVQEENNSIGGSTSLSLKDVEPLIEMIMVEIKNQCRVWNDQSNQCRYSSKLLGIAMNLYLRSGRSAYEKFCEDSIQIYPSADYLAEIKQSQQITDGCCITQYEDQLKMRGDVKEEIGQLVVDEMKMTKDVIMNVKSNEIIGITKDFLSMKKIIKSWLDDKPGEIEDFNEPATHVNQWRYRSISGRSYNCEFWYNNGMLSGDTLLEQFTRVVMNCESIGSRVMGMVCDGGGNNARLMSLLRESGAAFPTEAWVGEDAVRTKNPYDKSRYIYLFHCATHGLKSMRNALFVSWIPGGPREFLCEDGNRIGRAVLDECFARETERRRRGTAPQTNLGEATIHLNRWSKMNVFHAKKCFEWKTLAEIADHLYSELGVKSHDGRLKVKDSQNENKMGYMVDVAQELKTLLKRQTASGKLSEERADAVGNAISSFEWLAHVHEIFINRLMNMNYRIGGQTIDRFVIINLPVYFIPYFIFY